MMLCENKEVVSSSKPHKQSYSIMLGCECIIQSGGWFGSIWVRHISQMEITF